MSVTKLLTVSLFTWACTDLDGEMKVGPICPLHPSARVRFSSFGQSVIVTCHQRTNHLVRLCERAQLETELQKARVGLDAHDDDETDSR